MLLYLELEWELLALANFFLVLVLVLEQEFEFGFDSMILRRLSEIVVEESIAYPQKDPN